jgi:Ca2+-binding RTX toxin-like protein
MWAGAGADLVEGGDGKDFIYGEWGNDTIHSGRGWDVLTGGEGADTFRFKKSDVTDGSTDWITDFEIGVDVLDISGIGGLRATVVDGDTVVQGLVIGAYQDIVVLDNVSIEPSALDMLLA